LTTSARMRTALPSSTGRCTRYQSTPVHQHQVQHRQLRDVTPVRTHVGKVGGARLEVPEPGAGHAGKAQVGGYQPHDSRCRRSRWALPPATRSCPSRGSLRSGQSRQRYAPPPGWSAAHLKRWSRRSGRQVTGSAAVAPGPAIRMQPLPTPGRRQRLRDGGRAGPGIGCPPRCPGRSAKPSNGRRWQAQQASRPDARRPARPAADTRSEGCEVEPRPTSRTNTLGKLDGGRQVGRHLAAAPAAPGGCRDQGGGRVGLRRKAVNPNVSVSGARSCEGEAASSPWNSPSCHWRGEEPIGSRTCCAQRIFQAAVRAAAPDGSRSDSSPCSTLRRHDVATRFPPGPSSRWRWCGPSVLVVKYTAAALIDLAQVLEVDRPLTWPGPASRSEWLTMSARAQLVGPLDRGAPPPDALGGLGAWIVVVERQPVCYGGWGMTRSLVETQPRHRLAPIGQRRPMQNAGQQAADRRLGPRRAASPAPASLRHLGDWATSHTGRESHPLPRQPQLAPRTRARAHTRRAVARNAGAVG
jgi:hypothetical protein